MTPMSTTGIPGATSASRPKHATEAMPLTTSTVRIPKRRISGVVAGLVVWLPANSTATINPARTAGRHWAPVGPGDPDAHQHNHRRGDAAAEQQHAPPGQPARGVDGTGANQLQRQCDCDDAKCAVYGEDPPPAAHRRDRP